MKRNTDEYLHFFENSSDLLCIAGLDGFFKHLNPEWTRVLGHTLEELQTRPFVEFIHPDDMAATAAVMEGINAGKQVIWFENRYRCSDGSYRWLLWRATPVLETGMIYASARDVTEKKEAAQLLAEASAWQSAIFDSADFTIISTQPDGIIRTINRGALRKLGYSADEVVGKVTPAIIHDAAEVEKRAEVLSKELGRTVAPGFETFVAKARLDIVDENEWTYIRKDGSRFPVLLSVTALRGSDGEVTGFVGIGRDISERKRAERMRSEAENLMRVILDHTPAVVFVKNVKGQYRLVNKQFESLFHVSMTDLIGKTDLDLFPPDIARAFQENDRIALQSDRPLQVEEIAPHDDGPHTYLSTKFSILNAAGKPKLLCGIATDITARKSMEMEIRDREERLRAILDTAVEGIVTIDSKGLIQACNPAASSMFGYASSEMIGKSVSLLMAEAEWSEDCANLKVQTASGEKCFIGAHGEVEARRKDGSSFPILLSMGECWSGHERLLTGIMHDNTERKRAEMELQRSNRDLEQFAYVASHDLHEPLRMVTSYLQMLQRHYGGNLDDEATLFLNTAVDGAKRMRVLIQDLLAYSRVGSRGRPLIPTRCEDVLRDALTNLKVAIDSAGARVTHDPMPVVVGDGIQIMQLLQNLIGNALKFCGDKTPEIHVGAVRDGNLWTLSVADQGIGIDPQFFGRIFEIFQRLHTRSEYEGTGIGLAVCKRIVERHNGRIWVASEPEHGATFFFTLPAAD